MPTSSTRRVIKGPIFPPPSRIGNKLGAVLGLPWWWVGPLAKRPGPLIAGTSRGKSPAGERARTYLPTPRGKLLPPGIKTMRPSSTWDGSLYPKAPLIEEGGKSPGIRFFGNMWPTCARETVLRHACAPLPARRGPGRAAIIPTSRQTGGSRAALETPPLMFSLADLAPRFSLSRSLPLGGCANFTAMGLLTFPRALVFSGILRVWPLH